MERKMNITKRKRKMPVKREKGSHEAMLDGPTGAFWTLRLEPWELYVVGDNVAMSQMTIKNLGPGTVRVYAGYGDHKDLAPGKLLVTTAYAKITVESKEEKPALVEMQLLPASR
jgi:hypothetical protein